MVTAAVLLLVFSTGGAVSAHSEFIEPDQSAVSTKFTAALNTADRNSFVLSNAYSVDGIVDVSLKLGAAQPVIEEIDRLELSAEIDFGFTLIKQGHFMPVTLVLFSKLGVRTGNGTHDNSLKTTSLSTGYGFGMEVYRYQFILPRLYFRLGGWAGYGNATYISELESGDHTDPYPYSSGINEIEYGVLAGFSWRPDTPNQGIAVSGDLGLQWNRDGVFSLVPSIALTLVQNGS